MNRENVLKAIAIMERAKERGSLSQSNWQLVKLHFAKTEEALHACGNKACFAGYIAVSPEWIADGGGIQPCGSPKIWLESDEPLGEDDYLHGAEAVAYWLDIPIKVAVSLIYRTSSCYDKEWEDVTAQDVIDKLQLILDGEFKLQASPTF